MSQTPMPLIAGGNIRPHRFVMAGSDGRALQATANARVLGLVADGGDRFPLSQNKAGGDMGYLAATAGKMFRLFTVGDVALCRVSTDSGAWGVKFGQRLKSDGQGRAVPVDYELATCQNVGAIALEDCPAGGLCQVQVHIFTEICEVSEDSQSSSSSSSSNSSSSSSNSSSSKSSASSNSSSSSSSNSSSSATSSSSSKSSATSSSSSSKSSATSSSSNSSSSSSSATSSSSSSSATSSSSSKLSTSSTSSNSNTSSSSSSISTSSSSSSSTSSSATSSSSTSSSSSPG